MKTKAEIGEFGIVNVKIDKQNRLTITDTTDTPERELMLTKYEWKRLRDFLNQLEL